MTGRAVPAVLATLLLALTASVAQGEVVRLHGRAYGEQLTPRAHAITQARKLSPLIVGGTSQPPLTYEGGPLMLSSTLYLIFWGEAGSFAAGYSTPLIQYAEGLQADHALSTDEFSVARQYENANGEHIGDNVSYGGDLFDTTPYPALDKGEGCTAKPCVTDSQIHAEILKDISEKGWPENTPEAPEAQYLVYTPKGVTTCDEPGSCSNTEYCAYHSQITGIGAEGKVATYSDLPYVSACDSEQAPAGVGGNADADGTLDSEIHELMESATDPSPPTGYTDSNGEEAADKCTYPVVEDIPEIYGTPLGGNLGEFTAFNQLIDGRGYYTQQIWSNAPTQTPADGTTPAGCVARIGPTPSFTAPASPQTGHAVAFDASDSYDVSAPITTYAWNYGDGSTIDTSSGAHPTHYYVTPGTYNVTLTVSDASGSADASTQTLPITVGGLALEAPSAAISAPTGGGSYEVGQVLATSFSCTEATGAPGIASCVDSNDSASSPGTLDTSTAGPHSYTVTATSLDGLSATASIQYTVTAAQGGTTTSSSSSSSASTTTTTTTTTTTASTTTTTTTTSTPIPTSTSSSGSSGAGAPAGSIPAPSPGTTKAPGAKTAVLTRAQKLARALAVCRKLKPSKRAACTKAAKKRYAPSAKPKRKKTK